MKPQTSTPAGTAGSSCVRHTTLKTTWRWWTIAPLFLSILSFNVFHMHQHYDRHVVVVSPQQQQLSIHLPHDADFQFFINTPPLLLLLLLMCSRLMIWPSNTHTF
jgi:hypothetical protein